MRHDDLVYVRHMLDQAELAVSKLGHKTRAEYDADDTLRLALTHLVQTFGEAAGRVSMTFRARCPEVPWERVIGMRHRIVHDYLDVDFDIVWDVVRQHMPALIRVLRVRVIPEAEQ